MSKNLTGNALWHSLSKKDNPTTDSERRGYNENGLETLAYAIVQASVEDYYTYHTTLKKLAYEVSQGKANKNTKKYKTKVVECKRGIKTIVDFFHSETFSRISEYNGDWLLEILNKRVEEYNPEEEEEA